MQGGAVRSVCFLGFLLSVSVQAEDAKVSKAVNSAVQKRSYNEGDITTSEYLDSKDNTYSEGLLSSVQNRDLYANNPSDFDTHDLAASNQAYAPYQLTQNSPSYTNDLVELSREENSQAAENEDDEGGDRSSASASARSQGGSSAMSSASASSKHGGFPLGVPYSGAGYSSQAQAQAIASAQSGSMQFNPHSLGNIPSLNGPGYSGPGSSIAQAQVLAQSGELGPYNPGFPDSGSNYAHAQANAIAQANNEAISPYDGSISGSSVAQAQANTVGQSLYGDLTPYGPSYLPSSFNTGYPNLGFSIANSNTFAGSGAQAEAAALQAMGGQLNYYNRPRSRVISDNEIFYPSIIYGTENPITCSRLGELHNLWTPSQQCMVCTCVIRDFQLQPVCVSCSTCQGPPPAPAPVPLPPQPEAQVSCDPLPTNQPFQNPLNPCQICVCRYTVDVFDNPDVQISCQDNPQCVIPPEAPTIPPMPVSPAPVPLPLCERFPKNVAFPHPNDACIICKCIIQTLPFGQHEDDILCFPNQDCDINTAPARQLFPPPGSFPSLQPFPSLPEYPNIPEQYPPQGSFIPNEPYPTPGSLLPTDPFVPIEPYPQPPFIPNDPFPLPKPFPESPPPTPEFYPIPQEIYPLPAPYPFPGPIRFPEVIKKDLLPWPPNTTPSSTIRPRPGPLPGPPPHESCRPYPPNTSFQHPWDECQICICTEAASMGNIEIELNCYTKSSCCIEPPIPEPEPISAPGPSVTTRPGSLQILDGICEYQSLGVEFLNPQDSCKLCSCQLFGSFVILTCKQANRPECLNLPALIPSGNIVYIEPKCRYQQPYQTFVTDCNICFCQSVFNYVVATCKPQPNCNLPFYLNNAEAFGQAYGQENSNAISSASSQTQSHGQGLSNAEALAFSQAQINGQSFSSADALTYGQGNSNAVASALSQAQSYGQSNGEPLGQYYGQMLPFGQAMNNPQSNVPSMYSQYFPGSSQSNAEAIAQAQSYQYGSQSLPGQQAAWLPGQSGLLAGGSQSSALAEAQSNTNNYGSIYQPGSIFSPMGNQFLPNTDAGFNQNQQFYPGFNLQQPGSTSNAFSSAEAISSAVNQYPYVGTGSLALSDVGLPVGQYPSSLMSPLYGNFPNYLDSQAVATANGQSSSGYNGNSYPYSPTLRSENSYASAQAVASANANSNYVSNYPSNLFPNPLIYGQGNPPAEVVSASDLYPAMYPRPISQETPLYIPGQNAWENKAQAEAYAQSESKSTIQNQPSTGGRPMIRSGRGMCKYEGDRYHHNCQACSCFRDNSGDLYSMCLGNPCSS